MARYVDIENPINVRGITFIDENHDVLISLSDLRKALRMLPAADVVPRAEVEEIFAELEFDIAQLDYDSAETRAIAIEGIIAELKKKYTERSDDIGRTQDVCKDNNR